MDTDPLPVHDERAASPLQVSVGDPGHGDPGHGDQPEPAAAGPVNKSMLEQMGGPAGAIASSVPVVVFVIVNALATLTVAIWAAVASAAAIAVLRVVRRQGLQPALSGLFGVAIAAYIAHRTGSAKGYFLLGIYTSLLYGSVFAVSIMIRRPLVGVVWSLLNGHGWTWRKHSTAVRAFDVATLAWVVVFGARFAVQQWLYGNDQTGWLAVARIAMGLPLYGLALLVTVWAIRRSDQATADPELPASEG